MGMEAKRGWGGRTRTWRKFVLMVCFVELVRDVEVF